MNGALNRTPLLFQPFSPYQLCPRIVNVDVQLAQSFELAICAHEMCRAHLLDLVVQSDGGTAQFPQSLLDVGLVPLLKGSHILLSRNKLVLKWMFVNWVVSSGKWMESKCVKQVSESTATRQLP